ncbi:MAG: TetR/AcrR family transcriptional regulator [Polyangiaceae bacterium]|nr:TetR/AcrR family transcriptional regulator [Polyangiaceae bacterium]
MGVAARRQREKEERRAAILGAAEKVFAGKGVQLATMDDIAHEAELSKGTLYLYFDSKDELFLEIAVRAVRALIEVFAESGTDEGDGHSRVARMMRAYARFGVEQRDRFRVAVGWMTTDPGAAARSVRFEEYKRLVAEIYQQAAAAIELGKRDGTIRPELDTTVLFAQLWGATLGVLTLQLNATQIATRMPTEVALDDVVVSTVELLLRSIGTGSAAESMDGRALGAHLQQRTEVA